MVVVWVVLAVGFVLFELHHLAFYALFAAIGCAAAAAVAVVGPEAYVAQGVVAATVALAGAGLVRPSLRAAYERRHPHAPAARGVHGGLVGYEAVTLDEVGGQHQVGHVRLVGERWLAISETESTIAPGSPVIVTAVRGTTLVVCPVDALHGTAPAIGPTPDPDPDPSRS